MQNVAVVAIAYNRPDSLSRLLTALGQASYFGDAVDLIVSIDWSPNNAEVRRVADACQWPAGNKKIRVFSERQGLREHVLKCGDLVQNYSAIVMFEDDIVPSPAYYHFVRHALVGYGDNDAVAGISLYSPSINEMAERPFTPEPSIFDVYALQSAQSWGQCWTQEMWFGFRHWYQNNAGPLRTLSDMPKKIYTWPDSSWKKYFMKYLVCENKYFIYPYDSLSSNAADVGFHNRATNSNYQVPMINGIAKYRVGPLEDLCAYDVFFERENLLYKDANDDARSVCVDLYGTKTSNSGCRLVLTRKKLKFPVAASFRATYRPHEANFRDGNIGNDIYLYDMCGPGEFDISGRWNLIKEVNYHLTNHWFLSFMHGANGGLGWLMRKIRSIAPVT